MKQTFRQDNMSIVLKNKVTLMTSCVVIKNVSSYILVVYKSLEVINYKILLCSAAGNIKVEI